MRILAIAGPTGSGKSTLAAALVKAMGGGKACILALDSYYRDLSELDRVERDRWNFDDPAAIDADLLVDHLDRLSKGEVVEVPVYDFVTHTRREERELLAPTDVLILEGLHALYWPEVRDRIEMGVFISLGEGKCLERRMARDIRERGRSRESVLRQFEESVLPMQRCHVLPMASHADLVLQGEDPLEKMVKLVVRKIA